MATTTETTPKDYIISGTIAKVSRLDKEKATVGKDGVEKRVFLTIATDPFDTINMEGKIEKTNTISMNAYNLCNTIAILDPTSKLATMVTIAFGEPIKPQLLAIALQCATIKVQREFHKKGSVREDGISTYENDCYTSKLIGYSENIIPAVKKAIENAIDNFDVSVPIADEEKQQKKAANLAVTWQW